MRNYPPSVLFLLMTFNLLISTSWNQQGLPNSLSVLGSRLFLKLSWIWVFSWVGFKLITEKYSSLLCLSPEILEFLRIFNFLKCILYLCGYTVSLLLCAGFL